MNTFTENSLDSETTFQFLCLWGNRKDYDALVRLLIYMPKFRGAASRGDRGARK